MLIEISEEEREAVVYALKEYQSARLLEPRYVTLLEVRRRLSNLKQPQYFSKSELNELDKLLADAINETRESWNPSSAEPGQAERYHRLVELHTLRGKLLQLGSEKKVCFADVEHQFAEMHRGAFHYPGFGEIQKERRFRKNVETKLKKLKQGLKELADAI